MAKFTLVKSEIDEDAWEDYSAILGFDSNLDMVEVEGLTVIKPTETYDDADEEDDIEYCDKCGARLDKLKGEDIFIEDSSEVFCSKCYRELEAEGCMIDFVRVTGEAGEF